jgi:uncharacterized damage-inducible protein DinB
MSEKDQFLKTYQEECDRTMRVVRAYPADKAELKPTEKLRTARELVFAFANEAGLGMLALQGKIGEGPLGEMPEPPAAWDDVLGAVDQGQQDFGALVRSMSDEQLNGKVNFFIGPKQIGEVRAMDLCWFLLHDQIHHRGQLSIYVRLADGNLPSIYGPTADEPWM